MANFVPFQNVRSLVSRSPSLTNPLNGISFANYTNEFPMDVWALVGVAALLCASVVLAASVVHGIRDDRVGRLVRKTKAEEDFDFRKFVEFFFCSLFSAARRWC